MANPSHKRETDARRPSRAALLAAPLAAAVTLGSVGFGVLAAEPRGGTSEFLLAHTLEGPDSRASVADILTQRETPVTRASGRTALAAEDEVEGEAPSARDRARAERQADRQATRRATRRAAENADTPAWSTTALNLWGGPGDDAEQHGTLDARTKVLLTGRVREDRVEIVLRAGAERTFWVTEGYFADEEPPAGPSTAPCANGASATGGENVQKVLRATCAFAPEIRSYGGIRGGGGDHGRGRALDIMVSGERGWQIARYLQQHHAQLGITYIIYAQRIWSTDRAGDGWRGMSNRGSVTANHFDHVHVSVR